jgi:hypothetical protein
MTPRSQTAVAAAILAVFGACVAALFAFVSVAVCENNCGGRMTAQLAVAFAGIAPAACLLFAVIRGRARLARASLVVAVVTYAVWALLLDAAVHG